MDVYTPITNRYANKLYVIIGLTPDTPPAAITSGDLCARHRRNTRGSYLLGFTFSRDYLYSVPYLRPISLTCSRVGCFGGTPGGLQVSRKKPSKPGGAMIQSRKSS